MPVFKAHKAADKPYIELATAFIDKYMPAADGTYVKVYLLGLRQCFSKNPLDLNGMARTLNILLTDVKNAWMYWENAGIVRLIPSEGGGFDIEFEDIIELEKKAAEPLKETRPSYTAGEIAAEMARNPKLVEMYHYIEGMLCKTLSTSEVATLYSFYDWLKLPLDVIPLIVNHCISLGKKSMRYIEKVAISWADKGINTQDKAEEYLKQIEEDFSKIGIIKKKLGITGRQLTEGETKYMNCWIKEMGHSPELIIFAGEITVSNTGRVSFAYMDKILREWYQKGVKTPKQAEMAREALRQARAPADKKGGASSKKASDGVNTFTGEPIDFDAIERKAIELLHKKKSGD